MNTFETPIPLLENGDRLTRSQFEYYYSFLPPNQKAELIEGVIYIIEKIC